MKIVASKFHGKNWSLKMLSLVCMASFVTAMMPGSQTEASLLYYEGFEYGASSSSLVAADGVGGWDGDTQLGYVPQSLDYANLEVSGGSAIGYTDDGTTYVATKMFDSPLITGDFDNKFYFGFLISINENDATIGNGESGYLRFYMPQNSSDDDTDGNRSVSVPWDSSAQNYSYQNTAMSIASTGHSETTLIVFYFPGAGENPEYWVNPDPTAAAPSLGSGISVPYATYANRITGIEFAARNLLLEVDEIRFGTDFVDVVPLASIPEPASLAALVLLGLSGLLLTRRPQTAPAL